MLLSESKKRFLRRCIALNLAEGTLVKYERTLNRFFETCTSRNIENAEDITANDIRAHLAKLAKDVNPNTLKVYFDTIKSYFNYLYRDKIIPENVVANIETPKREEKTIPAFNRFEIDTILNSFDKSSFLGFRNYTIACTLFATGLRRAELSALYINSVNFDVNIIKVVGKGKKYRDVPLSHTLRKVILKYLQKRGEYIAEHKLLKSPYLIINKDGERLGVSAISGIIAKIGKNENITGVRVSPHTFRHTFAKFFLLNGGDLFSLQKILGHSDIEMTKRYVEMNEVELKIQNDKFNPFDNTSWRYL